MTHTVTLSVLFLLSLGSFVCSKNCHWLRPHQEYLNKQVLQRFKEMSPIDMSSEACTTHAIPLKNIDNLYNISQAGDAAVALHEVFTETSSFYGKLHKTLQCQQEAWEKLQQLLYFLANQMAKCIPETSENPYFKEKVSEYFNGLEKIVEEQESSCARRIIHFEIKRNLQLATLLSSRMRRHHLQN